MINQNAASTQHIQENNVYIHGMSMENDYKEHKRQNILS